MNKNLQEEYEWINKRIDKIIIDKINLLQKLLM